MSTEKDKELLDRISSLEEYLGVKYVSDDGNEYNEHITGEYGLMVSIKEKLGWNKKRNRWPWS